MKYIDFVSKAFAVFMDNCLVLKSARLVNHDFHPVVIDCYFTALGTCVLDGDLCV